AAPAAEDTGGDIVESVGDTGATLASAAPPAPPERFQFGGWARASVEVGFAKDNTYHADAPDPLAPSYHALGTRWQLLARTHYARGRTFEAAAGAALSYTYLEESPAAPDATFDLVNGQQTRGALEVTPLELYFGFSLPRFDLRVGQQRVAWGHSDV